MNCLKIITALAMACLAKVEAKTKDEPSCAPESSLKPPPYLQTPVPINCDTTQFPPPYLPPFFCNLGLNIPPPPPPPPYFLPPLYLPSELSFPLPYTNAYSNPDTCSLPFLPPIPSYDSSPKLIQIPLEPLPPPSCPSSKCESPCCPSPPTTA